MDINRLKELIIKYRENREFYCDSKNAYNETECRDEYISPLLQCFGWDVQNEKGKLPQYKEVVVERFSNSSERPDYTLTLNGVSKFFVEAKKPSVDITIDIEPSFQARKYGWNAKHAISLLTNFENLMIYDTTSQPKDGDEVRTSLYRKYYFEEYAEKFDEISELISRESVYSGKYDSYVENNFNNGRTFKAEIDEIFLKQMNVWRLKFGEYLYSKDEKYHNVKLLNDTVQDFINQIIFLRICEDRKLPLYKKLYEMTSDRKELQRLLTESFKEADKRYNSGLFRGENPIFDLSSDLIFEMIESLYYPKNPYLFTVIEPSILGKIYESFLTESIVVSEDGISLSEKKEYKYKSVVSTPIEIVKYMVKNTLDPLCEGKTPEQISKLKIIDIACGSGIFLEEVYQYLVDACVSWYLENDESYLLELSGGKKKLPIEDKKKILTNCIYGVDIDIYAVEVSKFSLLLKLLEDETEPSVKESTPILPELSMNIMAGNSLVTSDDISKLDLSVDELLSMIPFDWSSINDGNKFDVVLGNPPYVKTEDIHLLSGEKEFNIYKSKYKSAYKQFDKYFLFVEKALSLLNDNGVLCYIIPNKFFKIAAGQELRKLICKNVIAIDDFGDAQLFPDKTIYSSIVSISEKKKEKMKYSYISNVVDLWLGNNINSIDISTDELTGNPWSLSSDIDFMKMIQNMQSRSISLSEVADIFNGIQTSAERAEKFSDKKEVYWFDSNCITSEDEKYIYVHRFEKDYKIEKNILKPYFKPTKVAQKGMGTYSVLSTDKKIIFPYDKNGKLYSIETMTDQFKCTFEYLKDCYDRLVPRCLNNGVGRDVPDATKDTWYKYGRTQALTAFVNTPKLIVRVLSKEPMYAYDDKDMLIASGGTAGYCAISKKIDSKYDLEYIQAWLNHPFTEKVFQIQGSDFENGFTARGTYLLNKVHFVDLDFEDERQKELYDQVVNLTHKVYGLNKQMEVHNDKASKNVLVKEKNKAIDEIEDLISKVYRLEL